MRRNRVSVVGRRDFLLSAGAAAMLAPWLGGAAGAQDKPPTWEDVVKKIMGEAKPVDGKITLEAPEIAESGNTVPFTVTIESPMTEKEHVKAVHVISTGNPAPLIATYHFSPLAGRASAVSRMRLARTQDVVIVAALNDGRFLMGKRQVKVTIGGCGG